MEMEGSVFASFLRGMRLQSFLKSTYRPLPLDRPAKPQRPPENMKKPADQRPRRLQEADEVVDSDDYGWISVMISVVRIVVCFLSMMVTTAAWALVMLPLLPWPYQRVRLSNLYGHVTGRMLMWILGNPITVEGSEYANSRGIYICNHASPIDIFLAMWLTPTGTVGIAKREIIWYPLFGQLYVLANHLRIDRSNPAAAIRSINEVCRAILKNNLSLIIFPEGTRSKTGRLLPFKKGFMHIALQTRLPIVPMVFTGTHLAWPKNSLRVRPTPIEVKYLPPIKTDEWDAEELDNYIQMIHRLYVDNLPPSQKPVMSKEINAIENSKS